MLPVAKSLCLYHRNVCFGGASWPNCCCKSLIYLVHCLLCLWMFIDPGTENNFLFSVTTHGSIHLIWRRYQIRHCLHFCKGNKTFWPSCTSWKVSLLCHINRMINVGYMTKVYGLLGCSTASHLIDHENPETLTEFLLLVIKCQWNN